MSSSDQVDVRFPDELLAEVDALVEGGEFPNRSEVVRAAVRNLDGVSYREDCYTEVGRRR